jgi:hypothetical protein
MMDNAGQLAPNLLGCILNRRTRAVPSSLAIFRPQKRDVPVSSLLVAGHGANAFWSKCSCPAAVRFTGNLAPSSFWSAKWLW